MTPTPFSVIRQHLADGAAIECVEGKITKLFARKSGVHETHGEWSFQNGELADAAGDLIEFKMKNCPDLPGSWKGKTVRICSVKGDKGRNGLYAMDDEYKGEKTRKLKITPTATIDDVASGRPVAGLSQAVEEKLEGQATRPATGPATTSQAPPSQAAASHAPAGTADFLLNVKKRAARLAAMHAVCVDSAVHSAHGVLERHGYAMTPQAVLILADKIFMETVRRTDPDMMPMNPYKDGFTGKTLNGLVDELNKQVAQHRANMAPAAPAGAPPAPAASTGFFDVPEDEVAPF